MKLTLVIATRNQHKVQEIKAILGPDFECRSLAEYPGAPELIEDADTFQGNAARKADQLAAWLGQVGEAEDQYVLADDSGLEVDELNGAPGVHSARFAALDTPGRANSPDTANNAKLLRLLEGVPRDQRTAHFRCVLALRKLDGPSHYFEGICPGRIDFAPRGENGFGYDPLFVPDGFEESFAELGETVKNRLSHRAKALAKLRLACEQLTAPGH